MDNIVCSTHRWPMSSHADRLWNNSGRPYSWPIKREMPNWHWRNIMPRKQQGSLQRMWLLRETHSIPSWYTVLIISIVLFFKDSLFGYFLPIFVFRRTTDDLHIYLEHTIQYNHTVRLLKSISRWYSSSIIIVFISSFYYLCFSTSRTDDWIVFLVSRQNQCVRACPMEHEWLPFHHSFRSLAIQYIQSIRSIYEAARPMPWV